MSKTDEMLCENWGRTWLAVNFGALVGSRRGVSTDGVIAAGLVLLLLGQLKSLFNSDFLGHTRGWVTAYSVVKLVSLWAMEYFCSAVLPKMGRGDAVAATWIFRGDETRAAGTDPRSRSRTVPSPRPSLKSSPRPRSSASSWRSSSASTGS